MNMLKILEENIVVIENFFTKETLAEFLSCPYDDIISMYHFSLGAWIRNNLLISGNKLEDLFVKRGVLSEDDLSSLLIRLFFIYKKTK